MSFRINYYSIGKTSKYTGKTYIYILYNYNIGLNINWENIYLYNYNIGLNKNWENIYLYDYNIGLNRTEKHIFIYFVKNTLSYKNISLHSCFSSHVYYCMLFLLPVGLIQKTFGLQILLKHKITKGRQLEASKCL